MAGEDSRRAAVLCDKPSKSTSPSPLQLTCLSGPLPLYGHRVSIGVSTMPVMPLLVPKSLLFPASAHLTAKALGRRLEVSIL